MAESVDTTGPADEPTTTALWEHLKDDVVAAFGEEAEITVRHYSNHIEVSVIPEHVESTLERNYDDVTVVPYQAFQMAIRREEEGTAVDAAGRGWPSCAMRCHYPTFIVPSL